MLAALLLVCGAAGRFLRADISTGNRRPRSQSDAATSRSIFHPPLLYLGYGGLMVAASVALVSLLRSEFDGACARICWRWALPGWSALTAGIILGLLVGLLRTGLGRLVVLGSGGNASLLPWLSATALLHSLSLTRQRGIFRHWSLLLAIVTLMLSLLGTLIVRLAFWFRFCMRSRWITSAPCRCSACLH